MEKTQLVWPITAIMIVAIVVFGGGTMALLILGRDVPAGLWSLDGALVPVIVGIGGFFNMGQMHTATLAHLTLANTSSSADGSNASGMVAQKTPGSSV